MWYRQQEVSPSLNVEYVVEKSGIMAARKLFEIFIT